MEIGAGVLEAHGLSAVLDVREDQDVRGFRMVELVDDMGLGAAPAAGEIVEGARRQGLTGQYDDEVLVERGFDLVDRRVVERLVEIDAGDLGAKGRGQGLDRQHA
mgnify:CR=1 FL=1